MPTLFAKITRRSVAIRLKPLRRSALAALAVAALVWPDIGQAQTLAIHVQGNQLVNQNGALVHLRGVDFSGAEYACTGNGGDPHNELGYGIFDWPDQANPPTITGPTPSFIAGLKTWHINAVRLPLNETCWNGTMQQSTSVFQAWISGTTLYVVDANSGAIQTGASYPLSDVGGKLTPGTYITGQLSANGASATYSLNNSQTVIQTSFTGSISGWTLVANTTYTYTATLTVTGMNAGSDTIKQGLVLADPNGELVQGTSGGVYLSSFSGTGTGGAGTYTVTVTTNSSTPPGNIASETMYAGETMSQTDTSTAFPAIDPTYAGSNYQNAIINLVQALTANGIYVILDLHATAPDPLVAANGWAMADTNHSNDFWFSVATTFKNNPAAIFDLFNEPHLTLGGEVFNGDMNLGTTTDWACWKNGCYVPADSSGAYGFSFFSLGMQQLLNTVRAAGATNPVMLGGCCDYGQDFSQWSTYLPTDETPAGYSGTWIPQIIASYHRYGADLAQFEVDQQDEISYLQTVGQSHPVVAGEFGAYNCATAYVYPFMDFFDANGFSYLGWSWNDNACGNPSLLALTNNTTKSNNDYYYPTPTAEGQGLDYHLQALYRLHDTHDFSGDGMSDIFWRNTSGNLAVWLMNGSTVSQSVGFGALPSSFSVIGQKDFDGDGKADVLWRDSSGNVSMWFMNGTAVSSAAAVGNLTSNWTLFGTGDLNADGKGDLLWRDSNTGTVAVWFMNGAAVASTAVLGAPPISWTIVGETDGEILWRDSAGDIALWGVQGGQVTSSIGLGTVTSNFVVQGVGDFNGDGKIDILWRDTNTGALSIWFTNGTAVTSGALVSTLPSKWSVAQVGDYNGDGNCDILLLDNSGNLAMWLMSGATQSSSVGVTNVGTTWQVQNVNAN